MRNGTVGEARNSGWVRWSICALLFFATTVNYMDRQIIAILKPTLQHDLHWNESDFATLVVSFQFAYAIMMPFAGRMIDLLGTRIGYALAVAVWSLASMSHACASTLNQFAAARFGLGVGESANFPAAIKTVADWFPKKERAFATGVFNSGSNLGAMIAPLLVPFVALRLGWRAVFLVTGSLDLLWLAVWLLYYRQPAQHKLVSAGELSYIQSDGVPEPPTTTQYSKILRQRAAWAFICGKFMTDPVWWFYLFWVPKWLNETRHIDIASMGAPIVVIYLISTVGSIGGGYISSAMLKRGHSVNVSRKTGLFVCACCVLPILLATQVQSLWLAVSLVGLAAAGHQGWSANIFTTASDMFPRHALGSVVGLGGMAGSVGAVIFSTVIGNVLERSGNYWVLFLIGACAYLLAFAIMHALVPRMRQIAL
jgi:ACS family hexuronate transporter-like MFS transporter